MKRAADHSARTTQDEKGRLRSGDLFIVCLILLAALGLLLLRRSPSAAAHIEIFSESAPLQTLELSRDGVYPIDEAVTVSVSGGGVRILHADCPDRLCMQMGTIRKPGQMLVCLPNRLLVRIVNTAETEADAVVY